MLCSKLCLKVYVGKSFWRSFHTLFALLREKDVLILLWQNTNYCRVIFNCGQSLKKEYAWPDSLLYTPIFYRFRFPRWKSPGRRLPQLGGRDPVVHLKVITGKVISCIVPSFLILSPVSGYFTTSPWWQIQLLSSRSPNSPKSKSSSHFLQNNTREKLWFHDCLYVWFVFFSDNTIYTAINLQRIPPTTDLQQLSIKLFMIFMFYTEP